MDFAIPMDHHVKEKEEEKIEKCMDLAAEVRRQFRVKTVIVPIFLGALGTAPAKIPKSLEKFETEDVIRNRRRYWKLANCCINIHYSYT